MPTLLKRSTAVLAGAALIAVAAGAAGPDRARGAAPAVLVVGDSLEQGTGPYLRQALPEAALTIDAQKGRTSHAGLGVLGARLRPGDRVVVFDLGVNDNLGQPGLLAADLQAARLLAGRRCLVVASLERRAIPIDALDGVVRDFAAATPGVRLVDWAAAARSEPGLLGRDGLHATGRGYALRAQLVASAVQDCLDTAAAPPPRPPRPRRVAPSPPPRPANAWKVLARVGPVRAALASLRAASGLIAAAGRSAIFAAGPGPPEPVLATP